MEGAVHRLEDVFLARFLVAGVLADVHRREQAMLVVGVMA